MLRRRDNFALYSELLVSPGLNKLVALVIMLYPITEREGLLELEQGYHHLPAISTNQTIRFLSGIVVGAP